MMIEVMEHAGAEPAQTPCSSPLCPFSASSYVRASFFQASCSHEVEPRTQVAPGLDPHEHREEMDFLHRTRLEAPLREGF